MLHYFSSPTAFVLVTCISLFSQAQISTYYIIPQSEKPKFVFTNSDKTPLNFWTLIPSQNDYEIDTFTINYEAEISLEGPSAQQTALKKTEAPEVKIDLGYSPANWASNHFTFDEIPQSPGLLVVRNFSWLKSNFEVHFFVESEEIVNNFYLDAFSSEKIDLSQYKKISKIEIRADYRASAILESSEKTRTPTAQTPLALKPKSNFAYFVMASTHDQNAPQYVVGISNAALIQKARDLLESKPWSERHLIVVAKIEAGHGNFNRNWNQESRTPWSWHTSEVLALNDFASQSCDGAPELVEDHLRAWLSSLGKICFWNYSILQELSPEQVATGQD